MKASQFGKNFIWGTATSSYQIEGAFDLDGKSPSIWDTFSHTKGKVKNGDHGDVACDHYHLYKDDVKIMKQIGFNAYRFSLSWPRIIPNGAGKPNQAGIDFYNRLIDELLKKKITPWVTLYHWDLPQNLEDRGGWLNRDIINWFNDYTQVCANAFADRVKHFIVLNEPFIFIGMGYLLGTHAPGKRGFQKYLKAAHHTLLAQAEAARTLRAHKKSLKIGTTNAIQAVEPFRNIAKDEKVARAADAILNRMWVDPVFGRGYPSSAAPSLHDIARYAQEGDQDRIKFNFDFMGINHYTRVRFKANRLIPYIKGRPIQAESKAEYDTTAMKWEIYPRGFYNILKQFGSYPEIPEIYITENGMALEDEVVDGRVDDARRIEFFENYLAELLKAKKEGVNIKGYFAWSLLDNFEWAEGYRPRFGLVHVDFNSLKRTLKDSALWFKKFLKK